MTQYTCDGKNAAERKAEQREDLHSYFWGYGLALVLTLVSFWLVYRHVLPRYWVLGIIGFLALVQMIVHFRFFLHIGLKRQREDLQLILFSALVLGIMVAGTLWIMVNLAVRMAPALNLTGVGM